MDTGQPILALIERLRRSGFAVYSVTEELGAAESTMRIEAPDGYELTVRESDYQRDPSEFVSRLRHHLRAKGYSC